MTEPLALLAYRKLLPGSQLKNRLEDLGYRVQTLADPDSLAAVAAETRPLVAVVDLDWAEDDILASIWELRQNTETAHVPVIAFGLQTEDGKKEAAAGVTLLASESAVLSQLPQLLDQALHVE